MIRNCSRGLDQTLFFLKSVIVGGIFVRLSPISNVKFGLLMGGGMAQLPPPPQNNAPDHSRRTFKGKWLMPRNFNVFYFQSLNAALDHNNVPIEIVDGFIGGISVTIPWSALVNDSTMVEIQNLELTIQPKQRVDSAGEQTLQVHNCFVSCHLLDTGFKTLPLLCFFVPLISFALFTFAALQPFVPRKSFNNFFHPHISHPVIQIFCVWKFLCLEQSIRNS